MKDGHIMEEAMNSRMNIRLGMYLMSGLLFRVSGAQQGFVCNEIPRNEYGYRGGFFPRLVCDKEGVLTALTPDSAQACKNSLDAHVAGLDTRVHQLRAVTGIGVAFTTLFFALHALTPLMYESPITSYYDKAVLSAVATTWTYCAYVHAKGLRAEWRDHVQKMYKVLAREGELYTRLVAPSSQYTPYTLQSHEMEQVDIEGQYKRLTQLIGPGAPRTFSMMSFRGSKWKLLQ